MHAGVVGVLLAAGRATRFGSAKLLHALTDGRPVALASAQALLKSMPSVVTIVAVVDANDAALREILAREGVKLIVSPATNQGMATSLATAVTATPRATGWVVALADMPFIAPQTIVAVARAIEAGAAIAAPVHDGRRGHPVGFSAKFRNQLLALKGDGGARKLLSRHADELVLLECDDAGILRDIDRPEDLMGPLLA